MEARGAGWFEGGKESRGNRGGEHGAARKEGRPLPWLPDWCLKKRSDYGDQVCQLLELEIGQRLVKIKPGVF